MIITDITWAFLYDARFALLGLTAASSTAIGWLRVVTWPSSVARPLATRHTAFWPMTTMNTDHELDTHTATLATGNQFINNCQSGL